MSVYVKDAISKFRRNKNIDMDLNFIDYVCDCYVKLNPCSYGKMVEKKIKTLINVENVKPSSNLGDFKSNSKFGEIKVSYLSAKSMFNITHIRSWQKIDYYLLCMIDCEDNFTPHFYLIPKYAIDKLSLNPMNGTKDSNVDNKNVEYRVTLKKNSPSHKLLMKYNILKGSDIKSLINHFNNDN